jgi:hypothetical protein
MSPHPKPPSFSLMMDFHEKVDTMGKMGEGAGGGRGFERV